MRINKLFIIRQIVILISLKIILRQCKSQTKNSTINEADFKDRVYAYWQPGLPGMVQVLITAAPKVLLLKSITLVKFMTCN